MTFQTVEFLGVGGHDDTLGQLLQPCAMTGQNINGVGIYHCGALTAAQLCNDGNCRLLAGSQARTNAQRIEVFGVNRLRESGFLSVELYDGFGNAHLQNVAVAFGCVGSDLSYTYAQTCFGGQHRSTCHTVAAGNNQGVTHLAFVGKRVALQQAWAHVVLLQQRVVGINLLHALFAQSDIQHLQFADEYLVFGEQERQLWQLQCQRHIGTDNVGSYIVSVVFGHQSRWHIDTYHLSGRCVDVFHERRETTGQRLVDARSEQSVNHQHALL